jgi:hypothetical protein
MRLVSLRCVPHAAPHDNRYDLEEDEHPGRAKERCHKIDPDNGFHWEREMGKTPSEHREERIPRGMRDPQRPGNAAQFSRVDKRRGRSKRPHINQQGGKRDETGDNSG